MSFAPEGASSDDRIQAGLVSVSADYFRTLGLDLTHGRSIRSDEVANPQLGSVPRPVVLNRSAADLMWRGEDPLGREIKLLGSIPLVVVGVVEDTKYESVRDAGLPVVFVPLRTDRGVSIVVRSRAPASVLPALRAALAAIDPNLPLRNARLVETQLATVLMPQRFGTMLFGVFAFIALCVAALGIYAVSAYTVVQRTHELGIRIALGAQRGDVLRAVMSRTMLAAAVGVVAGLATALAAARFATPFLFEVKADDSLSYLAAALLLGVTAMAASLVPARRAARVNPIVALQTDQ
jgi:ABC-type antimicrobial peptide transport system permease subunit